MSGTFPISRRGLLRGLAIAAGLRVLPGLADEKPPSDRGIGGTGISGLPGEPHAIGFIGAIQRFGSIYVNGDRIAYASDVTVMIDGRPSLPTDMRIGQVVKAVATRRDGVLATDRIEILSEVVGPVEALEGESMVVLGQRVHLGTTGSREFTLGQRVAISGLRRPDGTIAARLVEMAGKRPDQVVGPAVYRGWTLSIGGLALFGPDARFDGRRVVVRGRRTARGLMVKSIALDRLPDGPGVQTLSIEAYVSRSGNAVQFGSGLVIEDASRHIEASSGDQPTIVTIDSGPGGFNHITGMSTSAGPQFGQRPEVPATTMPAVGPDAQPTQPTGNAFPAGRSAFSVAPGLAAGAAFASPPSPFGRGRPGP